MKTDDLISRKELLEEYENTKVWCTGWQENSNFARQVLKQQGLTFKQLIQDAPAVEVEPVQHGRWEDVQETVMYAPDMKNTITHTVETCSVCRARVGFVGTKLSLLDELCPSCGAKMDGE